MRDGRARPGAASSAGLRSRSPITLAHSSGSCPSTSTPGRPVGHGRRQPADRGGDDRRAAGLRLERDQPERLGVAGHDGEVGGAVVVGDRRRGRWAARTGRCRRGRDRAARSVSQVGVARPLPLGPPTIDDLQRSVDLQPGGRAQQHVRRLERLDPADEQQRRQVGVEAEPLPGRRAVAGDEACRGRRRARSCARRPGRRRRGRRAGAPPRRSRRSAGRPRRRPAPRR